MKRNVSRIFIIFFSHIFFSNLFPSYLETKSFQYRIDTSTTHNNLKELIKQKEYRNIIKKNNPNYRGSIIPSNKNHTIEKNIDDNKSKIKKEFQKEFPLVSFFKNAINKKTPYNYKFKEQLYIINDIPSEKSNELNQNPNSKGKIPERGRSLSIECHTILTILPNQESVTMKKTQADEAKQLSEEIKKLQQTTEQLIQEHKTEMTKKELKYQQEIEGIKNEKNILVANKEEEKEKKINELETKHISEKKAFEQSLEEKNVKIQTLENQISALSKESEEKKTLEEKFKKKEGEEDLERSNYQAELENNNENIIKFINLNKEFENKEIEFNNLKEINEKNKEKIEQLQTGITQSNEKFTNIISSKTLELLTNAINIFNTIKEEKQKNKKNENDEKKESDEDASIEYLKLLNKQVQNEKLMPLSFENTNQHIQLLLARTEPNVGILSTAKQKAFKLVGSGMDKIKGFFMDKEKQEENSIKKAEEEKINQEISHLQEHFYKELLNFSYEIKQDIKKNISFTDTRRNIIINCFLSVKNTCEDHWKALPTTKKFFIIGTFTAILVGGGVLAFKGITLTSGLSSVSSLVPETLTNSIKSFGDSAFNWANKNPGQLLGGVTGAAVGATSIVKGIVKNPLNTCANCEKACNLKLCLCKACNEKANQCKNQKCDECGECTILIGYLKKDQAKN